MIAKISVVILLGITLVILAWRENNIIVVSYHKLESSKVSSKLRLLHVSDLHNKWFGVGQKRILDKIKQLSPDLFCITGDLVDGKKNAAAKAFISELVQIAPVFYVTGNHEYMAGNFEELRQCLNDRNVQILLNTCQELSEEQPKIVMYGIDDPYNRLTEKANEEYVRKLLDSFQLDSSNYNVLLSHRPELFHLYSEYGFDLVLCGHAHGGQVRIPGIGGVIAPNQGLLPRYTEGLHRQGSTHEIISRGLGNSVIPLRINNLPELIMIELG